MIIYKSKCQDHKKLIYKWIKIHGCCCKPTRHFCYTSGTVHAQPRWGRVWGTLTFANLRLDWKMLVHVLGFDSKLDYAEKKGQIFWIQNSIQPQTAVFSLHFCLDFASCSVVLCGWMEGLSLLPTWPGGSRWISHQFPPVTVTGSGGGEPDVSAETWMFQHLRLEGTAAQIFEAIDVWVFWDVEILGLFYFFPVFHFALLMRHDGSKHVQEKKQKLPWKDITPIVTQPAKKHDIEIHIRIYIYILYTSVVITILNSNLIRSIQVPLLASTPWQQDWKWKDKDFGLHGYSAQSLRMKICWKPYWNLLPFEKS